MDTQIQPNESPAGSDADEIEPTTVTGDADGFHDAPEPITTSEEPQPTISREEIAAIARGLKQRARENARPAMSEPEFAAWYQAYLVASSVFAMDSRMGSNDKGRLAEAQADAAILVWRNKRMREGMPV